MSTWRTVFRLEWRILKRDRAALAILGIFALFLIVAAVAGGRHSASLDDGMSRSLASERAHFSALQAELTGVESLDTPFSGHDPRDPVWMGQEGAARLAMLPPSPLSPIAVGQRDLHPQAVRVTTGVHLSAERETETPMSGPTRLMTGAFDPTFLFVVLFPLVIIALSYELLSGERERGTLAMLLSQPVSQLSLVLGKATARALVLCAVTLIFALIGLLIANADLGAPAAWLHVGLYALVLVAWALFWFATAVAVNAWGNTSVRNALLLVGLWLVLVVVVPGLVYVVVDTFSPPPSRIELVHETREAARDVNKELKVLEGRHDVDTKTQDYAKKVVEVEEELVRRSTPVHHELQEQLRRRQDLVDNLRFLSPAIVVQLALEDIAGAGSARHQRFETQVEEFHDVFRAFFVERVRKGERLTTASLATVPRFTFEEEPAGALIWRVFSGILALFLAVALLIGIALPGLRKIGRLTR